MKEVNGVSNNTQNVTITDERFIENVLLKDFLAHCNVPDGFQNLVSWIKSDIIACNEEINDGTIATHYRFFIEKAIEDLEM